MKIGDLVKVCQSIASTNVTTAFSPIVYLEEGSIGLLVKVDKNPWPSGLTHQVYFQSLDDHWWVSEREIVKFS